jgi:hypothetical protein
VHYVPQICIFQFQDKTKLNIRLNEMLIDASNTSNKNFA